MTPDNRTEILLSLPNPFTPMAFLPPDLAWQLTVSTYWIVGSLAVLIWDILSNLHNDYTLLTKYPLKLSMIVYCISRITSLAHLCGLAVFITAPLSDCSWFAPLHVLYLFSIPTTSLLFFFRVCALYYNNKFVKAFFFISWLGVLGGSTTPIPGVHGIRLGISRFCTSDKLPSYVGLSALFPLVNDTLVYCATTYALLRHSHVDAPVQGSSSPNRGGGGRGAVFAFKVAVLFGNHLPGFSRAVLHDGQVYYLTTLSLAMTAIVMIFTPGVPAVYAGLIGVPNVVIVNCMACLVYRNVRFGVFRERAANPTVTLRFASADASRGTGDDTQPATTTVSFCPTQSSLAAKPIQVFPRQGGEEKFQLAELGGSSRKSGVDDDMEGVVGSVKHRSVGLV